jgi:hypothetical protein
MAIQILTRVRPSFLFRGETKRNGSGQIYALERNKVIFSLSLHLSDAWKSGKQAKRKERRNKKKLGIKYSKEQR